ncbi:MAG TPA: hypothetical protein PLZ57_09575 [Pseudobdellovibrionaceae bacterium]|nr:hypothetical protein [Pseudobdellovibrionaceae bacterium]
MSFLVNKFILNQDNELTQPQLHDCEIIELKLSGAQEIRTLTVQLVDESGVNIRMTLKGARLIHCTSFRAQNVVSQVSVYSRTDCSKQLQALEGVETSKDITSKLNAQIMVGDLGLVRVFASVGCEIFCVCENLEIA